MSAEHPYIPATDEDRRQMLAKVGAASVDDLFREIVPANLLHPGRLDVPPAMGELELSRHLAELAAKNRALDAGPSFLGAGSYDHFVPTVIDHLASRGEFLTSYTPYQPEASQGSLQAFFEFQSLVCELTAMDVANASLYEGATALVEALLVARAETRRDAFVCSQGLHPEYRAVLRTYAKNLGAEVIEVPLEGGATPIAAVRAALEARKGAVAAVAWQSPNFYGVIEDGPALADAAHAATALAVPHVDPISLAILKPPGEYGADLCAAEGQPLGAYPAYGGPYCGILAAREQFVRKLPGRLVGQTKDHDGKRAFCLTLQTREQHIRREKATSNICTNQGLLALRAAMYLVAMGPQGLREVAEACLAKARYAAREITRTGHFRLAFDRPFFKEVALRCPAPATAVNRWLAARGIVGGFDGAQGDPAEDDLLVLCFTEKCTRGDIDRLVDALRQFPAAEAAELQALSREPAR